MLPNSDWSPQQSTELAYALQFRPQLFNRSKNVKKNKTLFMQPR
jgi:hypothetical protein